MTFALDCTAIHSLDSVDHVWSAASTMDLSGFENLQRRFGEAVAWGEGTAVHPIGSPGYELPDLAEAEIIELSSDLSSTSISVIGSADRSSNFVVVARQSKPYKLKILLTNKARNNVIVLGRDCQINGEFDIRANNGLAIIGDAAQWTANLYVRFSSDNETFYLGPASKSNGIRITIEGENRAVIVGADCMFAGNTEIRTSDLHGILSMVDASWLNQAEDVLVEPHVWLGVGAMVMRGSVVGFGSIIGARSLVTHSIPRFSLAVGTPAKVIKSDVSWDSRVEPRADLIHTLRDACARLVD